MSDDDQATPAPSSTLGPAQPSIDLPADAMPLLVDLARRGLLADHTDLGALNERLGIGPITLYCGFDPTASSLHAGNLQQLMLLRRFAEAGHRPLVLVGGATGRIGDPSGRDTERPLLDDETIDANVASIAAQAARFVEVSADTLVNNRDWTAGISLLDFLRDVGKFANISSMLARDSVRSRVDRAEGMSFTEFSYQLIQANDFLVLSRSHHCELQVAGSDQWGNITAGIDLARRVDGVALHGLTSPLIVRSDGKKFGKSTGGAIWLSADATSPYAFYQYWMSVPDEDVEALLLRLTMVPVDECRAVAAAHAEAPERRTGQRRLAAEMCTLVHGADATAAAHAASAVLFGADPTEADADTLEMLAGELPTTTVSRVALAGGVDPVELFVEAGLARSKGEVRKNSAGFRVNGQAVDLEGRVGTTHLLADRAVMLSHGKRRHHLVMADAE
ncbi:MAG: tyrosine--tRNA ligase [Microthrixaceae bacterium]